MMNPIRPHRASFDAVDLDLALLGCGPAVTALRGALSTLGHLDMNLVVHGESGTGKHATALTLHRLGARRSHPFFTLHLEGMSEGRIFECLFGARGVTSLAARARRATVYLESIEVLSPRLQLRLVSALDDNDLPGIRLIAGTTAALDEHVRLGRFLRALYDRIAIVQLSLPPLRERREDIGAVATAALLRWSERAVRPAVTLGEGALTLLEQYDWPANIRELLCVLSLACEHTRHNVVSVDRVRTELGARPRRHVATGIVPLRQVERDYLVSAMQRCGGNQTLAARRLGIGRSTLLRRLQACGYQFNEEPKTVAAYGGPETVHPLTAAPER
jgi:DNA-binding NtrC family response regulator